MAFSSLLMAFLKTRENSIEFGPSPSPPDHYLESYVFCKNHLPVGNGYLKLHTIFMLLENYSNDQN